MFAPEGLPFILPALLLLVVLLALALFRKHFSWFILSGLLLLFNLAFLYFFRDPDITIPDPGAIVSPVNGRIIDISETDNGSTKINIYLTLLDIHAIRAPLSSSVISVEKHPGKFHPAYDPRAGNENEYIEVVFLKDSSRVITKLFSGYFTRRIVCNAKQGDSLSAGDRIGFIRFGSRAEIVFPPGFECLVNTGDRLTGGETILGLFEEPSLSQAVLQEF